MCYPPPRDPLCSWYIVADRLLPLGSTGIDAGVLYTVLTKENIYTEGNEFDLAMKTLRAEGFEFEEVGV